MKKFKNFGYKQETIEVREISMGNLVHIICQALIAKDKKDMEIRIVDCYAGEVDVYNGMEDLLMQDKRQHDNRNHRGIDHTGRNAHRNIFGHCGRDKVDQLSD